MLDVRNTFRVTEKGNVFRPDQAKPGIYRTSKENMTKREILTSQIVVAAVKPTLIFRFTITLKGCGRICLSFSTSYRTANIHKCLLCETLCV